MTTLRELAREINEDRSTLRKWILKHFGSEAMSIQRDPNGSGNSVLVINSEMVESIRKQRLAWNGQSTCSTILQPGLGYFYAMLIAPELSSVRFKFGFANDVDKRAADHRTICPTLQIKDFWECGSCTEKTALLVVANHGVHVGGEVFDVNDWQCLKPNLDLFFSLISRQK
jgi:hypothetical protein